MRLKTDEYPFTVRKMNPEEGEGYLVEYPDVPGCVADGPTPEAAIADSRQALRGCLDLLKEMGRPIPKPGSATAASGQWRQRVPRSLHARLAAQAAHEGVSLNTLVMMMIAEGMGRREAAGRTRKATRGMGRARQHRGRRAA